MVGGGRHLLPEILGKTYPVGALGQIYTTYRGAIKHYSRGQISPLGVHSQ